MDEHNGMVIDDLRMGMPVDLEGMTASKNRALRWSREPLDWAAVAVLFGVFGLVPAIVLVQGAKAIARLFS